MTLVGGVCACLLGVGMKEIGVAWGWRRRGRREKWFWEDVWNEYA